jgi:hypothetical protein
LDVVKQKLGGTGIAAMFFYFMQNHKRSLTSDITNCFFIIKNAFVHGALASRPGITRFLSKKRLILKKGTSTSYCLSYLSIISQINVTDFPITSRDVTKKTLPARGIIKLFPARESLVSDIPTGDGKTVNLFLQ